MTDSPPAIFLSYASQDAPEAQILADALRAEGLEVWLDQSELRGGDAWDQKIRRQIKECALFVPIISAVTNSRAEGYFRLEWKLAVDRSHLMADDAPFIFPIATEGTSEKDSRVPDRFLEFQWMKLGRDKPEAIAARAKKLLAGEAKVLVQKEKSGRWRFSRKEFWFAVGIVISMYFATQPIWRSPSKAKKERPAVTAPAASEVPAAAK